MAQRKIIRTNLESDMARNAVRFTLAETLSGQDAAVFCLGTCSGAVSDAELRKVTAAYTIEFARVLRGSSPGAAFSFLSGKGVDPTVRSRMPFARYKREAANALPAAGFPHVYVFRSLFSKRTTDAHLMPCRNVGPRVWLILLSL